MGPDEWHNGLFSHVCGGDCGTCLGAWFCSCFLYGRTSKRLENFPDEEKPGLCNGSCWLMCGAACCHLHWLPALLKRGDVRAKYNIPGDGCTDCLASYFCYPCALAQMETEVKERARASHHATHNGYYQQQGSMVYGKPEIPQQQGHYH